MHAPPCGVAGSFPALSAAVMPLASSKCQLATRAGCAHPGPAGRHHHSGAIILQLPHYYLELPNLTEELAYVRDQQIRCYPIHATRGTAGYRLGRGAALPPQRVGRASSCISTIGVIHRTAAAARSSRISWCAGAAAGRGLSAWHRPAHQRFDCTAAGCSGPAEVSARWRARKSAAFARL